MKLDPFAGVYRALSPKKLAEMLMTRNIPKTEAEHWAVREIERLTRERDEARAEVERLKLEPETLRAELIAICNASRAALANAYDRARESRKTLEAKP